ncbi:MAG: hypothetical protein FWE21_09820, partial [Defluviitaleaceae bacterium]|nr:hypothetical protein [Defluviitaleaceae bacterium]
DCDGSCDDPDCDGVGGGCDDPDCDGSCDDPDCDGVGGGCDNCDDPDCDGECDDDTGGTGPGNGGGDDPDGDNDDPDGDNDDPDGDNDDNPYAPPPPPTTQPQPEPPPAPDTGADDDSDTGADVGDEPDLPQQAPAQELPQQETDPGLPQQAPGQELPGDEGAAGELPYGANDVDGDGGLPQGAVAAPLDPPAAAAANVNPVTGDDGPNTAAGVLAVPFFASAIALFGALMKRRKDGDDASNSAK